MGDRELAASVRSVLERRTAGWVGRHEMGLLARDMARIRSPEVQDALIGDIVSWARDKGFARLRMQQLLVGLLQESPRGVYALVKGRVGDFRPVLPLLSFREASTESLCSLVRALRPHGWPTTDDVARLGVPELLAHGKACCAAPRTVRRSTQFRVLALARKFSWVPPVKAMARELMEQDTDASTSLAFYALTHGANRRTGPLRFVLDELGVVPRPDELAPVVVPWLPFPAYCGVRDAAAARVLASAMLRKMHKARPVDVDWSYPSPRLDVALLRHGAAVLRGARAYGLDQAFSAHGRALFEQAGAPVLPGRPRRLVAEFLC